MESVLRDGSDLLLSPSAGAALPSSAERLCLSSCGTQLLLGSIRVKRRSRMDQFNCVRFKFKSRIVMMIVVVFLLLIQPHANLLATVVKVQNVIIFRNHCQRNWF